MALIPPFFLDCVVAIGVPQQPVSPTAPILEPHWIGTGFLVGRPVQGANPAHYTTYLVTNKHVIQGLNFVVLRFNNVNGAGTQDIPLLLQNQAFQPIWFGHPNPDVDVAVVSINPQFLQQLGSQFSFFALDQHCKDTAGLRTIGASEGDFIYVLGFPMGQVTPQTNYIIARTGIVARIRDVLHGSHTNYLIDASVYPGNSGGPVVSKPEAVSIQGTQANSNASLIGMVKAYIPYKDVAISQQTKQQRVIFEENSGLALVETVDSIQQTIQIAHQTQNPYAP